MTEKPPKDDELEISIFGPGYGEAIALHLGFGKWILVDSCLDPISAKPAQLQYLENLGIDTSTSVKLIVATHWHDDHVQGMGTLAHHCKAAEITISGALTSDHFAALLSLYGSGSFPGSSGVTEFVNVFRVLDERKSKNTKINPPKRAGPDRLLYKDTISINGNNKEVEIYSLSPSDLAIQNAELDFRQAKPSVGQSRKRITCPSVNHTSVVLWIRVGDHRILLGSDLEKADDPKTGWAVILKESKAVSEKALVYKVAHHGAASSHDPLIWSELLCEQPYALLSPFMIGRNSLPKDEDLARISTLTPHVYLTAQPRTKKFRTSNRVVKDETASVTKSIFSINTDWGQVRLRCDIGNDTGYRVELFGAAYKVGSS